MFGIGKKLITLGDLTPVSKTPAAKSAQRFPSRMLKK
jgi:hypothetical protein